jgi:hypothetical protein
MLLSILPAILVLLSRAPIVIAHKGFQTYIEEEVKAPFTDSPLKIVLGALGRPTLDDRAAQARRVGGIST